MASAAEPPRTDVATVFHDLVRLEIELWDAVDRRLREALDTPLAWLLPLQVVARTEGCRVNDIAADIGTTVGGTSKLVDRLEGAGHLRRRAHPTDRRSSIVELTAQGEKLVVAGERVFEDELNARLSSVLSPRALTRFAGTLRTLRSGGESGNDERTG